MKKFATKMLTLGAVAGFLVMMTGIAMAADVSASSKDVNKLKAEITMLNADAKLPQADKIISKQLADNFSIKSDKVNSLVGRNMQYGDVAAVLAFADKMPGGMTDANINQVLSLRQGGTGWDLIAKRLNVDVSDVAGTLASIEDDAHTNIKQALVESPAPGMGAGGFGESGGAVGGRDEGMSGGEQGGTGTGGQQSGPDSGIYGAPGGGSDTGTGGGMSGGTGGGY